MNQRTGWAVRTGGFLALAGVTAMPLAVSAADEAPASWTACGWGGGGFYYAAVFHPTQDGVIYMGGDVNGVYKSLDHGRNWRVVNNGIANYGVFSLAVDRTNPQTVYAATEGGLCKSTDGAEHWQTLPNTGKKELRLTGDKGKSIRCIAVDPVNGNILYAGSPAGKIFKSLDGGQTWNAVYEKKKEAEEAAGVRLQFGKVNGEYYGGLWTALAFPAGVTSADCVGFGFSFKGDKSQPRDVFVNLKTAGGASYRSKSIKTLFSNDQWQNLILGAGDFIVDPMFANKEPEKAKALPATPDWATVNRVDISVVGDLPQQAYTGHIGKVFFALTKAADGQAAPADQPILATVKEFLPGKPLFSYGNLRAGTPAGGTVYSVAVAAKDPALVLAATADAGLILSRDAGQSWSELPALPKRASSVAISPADANVIYAAFFTDGIGKSTDKGQTWTSVSAGLGADVSITEVAVSPVQPLDVYAIGKVGWGGTFFASNDGGATWRKGKQMTPDFAANPTLPKDGAGLSVPTNLAINPNNPKELFISANWRSGLSEDGGATWNERIRGADITCVGDIRFLEGSTYVVAMDEGLLVSDDQGGSWRQLAPMKYTPELSGHQWRVLAQKKNGAVKLVSTVSPWQASPNTNRVLVSEDGGKNFKTVKEGLPTYLPDVNCMWGRSYARALAADPVNPDILYLGMDGDAANGKSGGGVFKSVDGGYTWAQLAKQPASRRMFFGLAVDPTNSQRVYWGSCGTGGGVHRSEDGGASWKPVFTQEQWIFNVMTTADGAVYAAGNNLWRSTDRGATWKQLTKFTGRTVIGLEVDPRDAKTLWISATTWDGGSAGGVYRTRDGGATWQEITGDIPYVKPMVLRFNPVTRELWAGGVGLYKLKQ